jgi:GNAT superfamily N-acetyltransferase
LHHAHDGAFRHCSHLHGNSSNDGHPLISALSRISLRLLSREDARRVLNGQKIPSLIYEQSPRNTPGTFGHYQVEISESSTVIGGAGFLAPPDEFGAVQIDLQIVPDYLGRGYESEIVAELITIARENGALFVIATTKVRELRGQQTLEAGGLDEIVRDDTTVHFGLDLRL